jgi:hypothetical protein
MFLHIIMDNNNNVDLAAIARSAEDLIEFIQQLGNNNASFDNNGKQRFLNKLAGIPFERVNRDSSVVYDFEDADEDGPRRYDVDDIRAAVNNMDEQPLVSSVMENAIGELRRFASAINRGEFDGDDPSSAYSDGLHNALQNMMSVFNAATAVAGGRKRKSARKSRKSAKKSRKSGKKSRKSAKKSRKH